MFIKATEIFEEPSKPHIGDMKAQNDGQAAYIYVIIIIFLHLSICHQSYILFNLQSVTLVYFHMCVFLCYMKDLTFWILIKASLDEE
jgi:hypothetical protein